MEAHIISIFRFAVCLFSMIIAIVAMIKASDNDAFRRLSAILAAMVIFFNVEIGEKLYLMVGSTIEVIAATAGIGFVLVLLAVVMFLPLIFIIRWLTH